MCNSHNVEGRKAPLKSSKQTKGNLRNVDHDLFLAKSILQRGSQYSGANVFDHLSALIKRIIDDDPANVADYFEEYSRVVREEKFNMDETNYCLHRCDFQQNLIHASNIMTGLGLSLYPRLGTFFSEEEKIDEEHDKQKQPISFGEDIIQMHFYWKLCGFGVDQEPYILSHSIEKFMKQAGIKQCKFWGKMFGLTRNYYILEVEFTPEENSRRVVALKNVSLNNSRSNKAKAKQDILQEAYLYPGCNWKEYSAEELATMRIRQPALPKSDYIVSEDTAPDIVEPGLNHYSYFVCNDPLEQWVELPIVTPKQIMVSRFIKKYLTGNLNALISTHPPFPGKERHYLRALIARITHGTHVSPIDYVDAPKQKRVAAEGYDEEEEEDDEEKSDKDKISPAKENLRYESRSNQKLLNMKNWVHTRPLILHDGHSVSHGENVYRNEPEIDTEEHELEDSASRESYNRPQISKNAPHLRPICDNVNDFNAPCWSLRVSCQHTWKNMVIIVKSILWQGSYSFAVENAVHHLYVGWGHKYVKRNHSPMPLSDIQKEYIAGPEIIEILDSFENYLQINDKQLEKSQDPTGDGASEEEELEDEEEEESDEEEEDA